MFCRAALVLALSALPLVSAPIPVSGLGDAYYALNTADFGHRYSFSGSNETDAVSVQFAFDALGQTGRDSSAVSHPAVYFDDSTLLGSTGSANINGQRSNIFRLSVGGGRGFVTIYDPTTRANVATVETESWIVWGPDIGPTWNRTVNFTITPVQPLPEPCSAVLVVLGCSGLLILKRRRRVVTPRGIVNDR
jgi:hypothetical protein